MNFFYKKSKSNPKKKILAGGRGWSVARVSDFLFSFSKDSKSEKKKIFF